MHLNITLKSASENYKPNLFDFDETKKSRV